MSFPSRSTPARPRPGGAAKTGFRSTAAAAAAVLLASPGSGFKIDSSCAAGSGCQLAMCGTTLRGTDEPLCFDTWCSEEWNGGRSIHLFFLEFHCPVQNYADGNPGSLEVKCGRYPFDDQPCRLRCYNL